MAGNAKTVSNNEIHVILEGYSFTDNSGRYRANGTATLVRTTNHNIMVDTGSPRDKQKILDGLQNLGLTPEDIDHVVSTHGHVDHAGNLNLFPNAVHIMCRDICENDDIYKDDPFKEGHKYSIETGQVEVFPTPGHTLGDVSVIVYNTKYGAVVISGDLFECRDDCGVWQGNSECVEKQIVSRDRVLKMADWIVPGHGPIFQVEKVN
ncbi:predicted protein [Nematostella vectensis]|uniref:Metallo-beta-lactamase domain-containing protein 1 n=2 Tax=Nematostella vectensis TaxID=45351 RepID=A7RFI5_NEMVE|nr:predicted protein [Nematostella vectensis]|eukprot:XP_001641791.1 predicted protein [Nematostella vectensis]